MTVSVQSPFVTRVYTGPATYTFDFLVYDVSDLEIVHIDIEGVQTQLNSSMFTATTLQPYPGGEVVVTTTDLGTTGQLSIKRILPYQQTVDWINNEAFNVELLERSQDRMVMMIQQLSAQVLDSSYSINWRGEWVGGTNYSERDIASHPTNGNWYACVAGHESDETDFDVDIAAGYWILALDLESVTTLLSDLVDTGAAQIGLVEDEGDTQVARTTGEGTTQVNRVIGEGTTQVNRVIGEGTTQVGLVEAEGTTQIGLVEDEGDTQIARVSAVISGKNAIINGDFVVWQRGTSQTSNGYGSDDRWSNWHTGSTKTVSLGDFLPGATFGIPYNPRYFSRTVVTSVAGAGNYVVKAQKIESVRTFSGETVTLSFWAKADSSKSIAIGASQYFGSGGSTEVTNIGVVKVALTSSWRKIVHTFSLPSISGKVLSGLNDDCLIIKIYFDAGSNYNSVTNSLGQQSGTFDIAQVQLERGPEATEFEQQSVESMVRHCLRYYETGTLYATLAPSNFARAFVSSNSSFSVRKRVTPTMVYKSTTGGTTGALSGYSSGVVHTMSTPPAVNNAGMFGFVHFSPVAASSTDAVTGNWFADAEL